MMVSLNDGEDWRLQVEVDEEGAAAGLVERIEATRIEHALERSLENRIAVSREGHKVFCYMSSPAQADEVQRVISQIAADSDVEVRSELRRWHEVSESWELPEQPVDPEQEHQTLISSEQQESRERGFPEYEVRVECASRKEARALSEQLRGSGTANVRRSHYVLIGALDEDAAQELANGVSVRAPGVVSVKVEGTAFAVEDELGWNPFSVFGGMGG